MDISFSGAGFMGCYFFGIVDCWSRYIPRERVNRVAGASAGSLIAAYYLLDLPLGPCLSRIVELTEDIRRRPLGVFDRSNQIVDILPRILDELFPEDAHKRVSGKLFVSMTRLKDMKNVLVSEFETRTELIEALNCSCFIPVWSGNHVSTYKGVKFIDGGFSDNLPVFDEHTIRICCFSGPSDISPYDRAKVEKFPFKLNNTPLYLSIRNCRRFARALSPPPASFIVQLLERGFHDSKQFILSNDLIQCQKCYQSTRPEELPIFNLLTPTISPAISRVSSYEDLSKSLEGRQRDQQCSSTKATRQPQTSPIETDLNNNLGSNAPEIVLNDISETSNENDNDNDSNNLNSQLRAAANQMAQVSQQRRFTLPSNVPSEKFLQRRQSSANPSQTTGGASTGSDGDKFTLAPVPLPSCPPSPNLNRHCVECIRVRQEARMDNLEERVMQEASKFVNETTSKSGRPKTRKLLPSPLKWIKQLQNKKSYAFESLATV